MLEERRFLERWARDNCSEMRTFWSLLSIGISLCFLVGIALGWADPVGAQGYQSRIGYSQLVEEYGDSLATGIGLSVLMPESVLGGNYMPNTSHPQFLGKTFINGTSPPVTQASSHATNVGLHLYGSQTSIAPGINRIVGASAEDFALRYTGYASGVEPLKQGFHISNHSYIGNISDPAIKTNLLQRFDYIINRDNTIAVVGANNGASNTAPDLWLHSFNAISVGRSDGLHSFGSTTTYGPGRTRPDIVVPMQDTGFNFTSYATPVVGASAAILKQTAGFDVNGKSLAGGQSQVIRSLLFAGATKEEFPGWNKTSSRPIDNVYGFGELNIRNSYKMLEAGQVAATKNPNFVSMNMGSMGWDYNQFQGADLYYNFEIGPGQELAELSAALVWNVDVFNSSTIPGVFDPDHRLANLELELFQSNGTFLNTLVQGSYSSDYSYEHIYLTDPLVSGKYTFRIRGDIPVHYGFSWRMSFDFTTTPEPSSLLLFAWSLVLWRPRKRQ